MYTCLVTWCLSIFMSVGWDIKWCPVSWITLGVILISSMNTSLNCAYAQYVLHHYVSEWNSSWTFNNLAKLHSSFHQCWIMIIMLTTIFTTINKQKCWDTCINYSQDACWNGEYTLATRVSTMSHSHFIYNACESCYLCCFITEVAKVNISRIYIGHS